MTNTEKYLSRIADALEELADQGRMLDAEIGSIEVSYEEEAKEDVYQGVITHEAGDVKPGDLYVVSELTDVPYTIEVTSVTLSKGDVVNLSNREVGMLYHGHTSNGVKIYHG